MFSIAAPVLAEFLYGIQTLPRAKANLKEWQRYQDSFSFYDVQRIDAEVLLLYRLRYANKGSSLRPLMHLLRQLRCATASRC